MYYITFTSVIHLLISASYFQKYIWITKCFTVEMSLSNNELDQRNTCHNLQHKPHMASGDSMWRQASQVWMAPVYTWGPLIRVHVVDSKSRIAHNTPRLITTRNIVVRESKKMFCMSVNPLFNLSVLNTLKISRRNYKIFISFTARTFVLHRSFIRFKTQAFTATEFNKTFIPCSEQF
jgi:hypothetical protein